MKSRSLSGAILHWLAGVVTFLGQCAFLLWWWAWDRREIRRARRLDEEVRRATIFVRHPEAP